MMDDIKTSWRYFTLPHMFTHTLSLCYCSLEWTQHETTCLYISLLIQCLQPLLFPLLSQPSNHLFLSPTGSSNIPSLNPERSPTHAPAAAFEGRLSGYLLKRKYIYGRNATSWCSLISNESHRHLYSRQLPSKRTVCAYSRIDLPEQTLQKLI